MARSPRRTIDDTVEMMKWDYVEQTSQTEGGGYKTAFREYIKHRAVTEPELFIFPAEQLLASAIDGAVETAWQKLDRTADEDEEQPGGFFDIAGNKFERVFRYRDDNVPGKHRTIVTKYATVGQYVLAADLLDEKSLEVVKAAARRRLRANALVAAAGGDLRRRVSEFADVVEDAA